MYDNLKPLAEECEINWQLQLYSIYQSEGIYKDLLDWYRSSDIVVCKVLEHWSEAPKMQSIELDEGLMIVEEAIQKAKKIVEGYPETKFTTEEYTKFHAYP